jgi:hypothetical protein
MYVDLAAAILRIRGIVGTGEEPGIIRNLAEGRVYGHDAVIHPEWIANLNTFMSNLSDDYFYSEELLRGAIARSDLDMLVLGFPEDLARVLQRFTPDEWELVYRYIPDAYLYGEGGIQRLVNDISQIENFLTISMVEPSGLGFPGVIIPIVTGISMFISSWLMQQRTYDPNADERAVMTQKMMLFVMPVMMAVFTINLVAAVGVFWVTGQIFQITQDLIMMKKSGTPIRLPFAKPPPEVVEVVPSKKKKK